MRDLDSRLVSSFDVTNVTTLIKPNQLNREWIIHILQCISLRCPIPHFYHHYFVGHYSYFMFNVIMIFVHLSIHYFFKSIKKIQKCKNWLLFIQIDDNYLHEHYHIRPIPQTNQSNSQRNNYRLITKSEMNESIQSLPKPHKLLSNKIKQPIEKTLIESNVNELRLGLKYLASLNRFDTFGKQLTRRYIFNMFNNFNLKTSKQSFKTPLFDVSFFFIFHCFNYN